MITEKEPSDSIIFLFVGLDKKQSLQKKCGYMRQIVCSHFGCCCPQKELWSPQMNNVRSSHELQSAVRLMVGFLNIYY